MTTVKTTPMMWLPLVIGLMLAISACSGLGPTRIETEEVYRKHAGEPIDRIRYTGFVQDWQPVGSDAVMLSLARNRYFLLDLGAGCHLEARSSETLGLETGVSRQISRFDRIRFRDTSCQIEEIRPVDYQAARTEIREMQQEGSPSG